MYNFNDKTQIEKIAQIKTFNVINDISLFAVMEEEIGELIVECSKMRQGEYSKEHLLEELVGAMNTIYNVITYYYKTDEIDKMINKQLNKCIDKLNIK